MHININGKFYTKDKAKVSVFDRGFLYGDGVFETMRVYNGKIFALKEHVKRLWNSAKKISLELKHSEKEIETELYRTLTRNKLNDAIIRISITRGTGPFGLNIKKCSNPTMVIGARKFHPYPNEFYAKGVNINILQNFRVYSGSILNNIKSNNYLQNILARKEAFKPGSFETLLVNEKGYITEGTVSNVFVVKNGFLMTPPLNAGILPGITRQIVIKLAKKSGIKTKEKLFKPGFIFESDECFLTNTSIEILPTARINGIIFNSGKPGKITIKLKERFRKLIEKKFYGKS